jgi:hypothetical protein
MSQGDVRLHSDAEQARSVAWKHGLMVWHGTVDVRWKWTFAESIGQVLLHCFTAHSTLAGAQQWNGGYSHEPRSRIRDCTESSS